MCKERIVVFVTTFFDILLFCPFVIVSIIMNEVKCHFNLI